MKKKRSKVVLYSGDKKLVAELIEDLYSHIFDTLDASPLFDGLEAGKIATIASKTIEKEITKLLKPGYQQR